MRSFVVALGAALALGCDCGGETASRPSPAPSSSPASSPVLVDDAALPEIAGATSLTPGLELHISARGYRVTNRALVDSWPEPERAHAAAGAPPDHPAFPVVEGDVPLLDDGAPLLVPELRELLSLALLAERTRSGTPSVPRVVLVRAPGTLPWSRVARALYTAALIGLTEPWFIVRDGDAEGALRVPPPDAHTPPPLPLDLTAALRALATAPDPAADPAGAETPPEAPVVAPAEVGTPLSIVLEDHGLRVRRGAVELGPGCHGPSADASPAIPRSALSDGHTLSDCLAAVAAGPVTFSAGPDVTLEAALRALAVLATRGPVEIGLGS